MSGGLFAKMPKGIPYIIGNEVAERFSFYGMKAILTVYMTKHLLDSAGEPAYMSDNEASYWVHIFAATNYFLPLLGSILSDVFLGKYKTIILLSIVYCLGHLAMAMDTTQTGLAIGLTLIAIGAGGIKPCVSAHVGDQFTEDNEHLFDKIYSFFYFAINVGATLSSLCIPLLLKHYGPHVAFGVPGFLMLLATIIFWLGKNKYISIKPSGWKAYWKELSGPLGRKALVNLIPIYLLISVFWSLFEQTATSWVIQADKMDRVVNLGFTQFELLPSQLQSFNPFFILIFIPLFSLAIYPLIKRFFNITSMQKIWIGMVLSSLSFVMLAIAESKLGAGEHPSIIWHVWAYMFLTAGEIMISITALEFAYTQSPNKLKSFVMSFYLLSISLGNIIAALVNWFIQSEDGSNKLAGASYFWFFVILVLVAAFLLMLISRFYREETFIQPKEMRE